MQPFVLCCASLDPILNVIRANLAFGRILQYYVCSWPLLTIDRYASCRYISNVAVLK